MTEAVQTPSAAKRAVRAFVLVAGTAIGSAAVGAAFALSGSMVSDKPEGVMLLTAVGGGIFTYSLTRSFSELAAQTKKRATALIAAVTLSGVAGTGAVMYGVHHEISDRKPAAAECGPR